MNDNPTGPGRKRILQARGLSTEEETTHND